MIDECRTFFVPPSPRYVLRLIVSEINFSLSGKALERRFGLKVVDLNLPVLRLLFYVSQASKEELYWTCQSKLMENKKKDKKILKILSVKKFSIFEKKQKKPHKRKSD